MDKVKVIYILWQTFKCHTILPKINVKHFLTKFF